MDYRINSILLFLVLALAVSSPAAPKSSVAQSIHATNLLIDSINNAPGVRVDSSDKAVEWLGYAPEGGGTLWAFRRAGSICKLRADFYHSLGMVRIEIYYDHAEPKFLYEREDYFPKTGESINRDTLVYGHDAHYYLNHRTLIESKRRGKDKYGPKTSPKEAVRKLLLMSDRWSAFMKH